MADVSVKMGVSGIGEFKAQISQAQASVKTYDSALKLAEKQLKATGDAEKYMQDKTTALQGKLAAQKSVIASTEAALKSMAESGVEKTSTAYQNMENKLLQAQGALLDTQMQIQELGTESADAAGKTNELTSSLGGLNKKVSLDQVITGIGKITDNMEKAAQKAVELGKAIWENIADSARWSDDVATSALQLDMDTETYQRYKGVFDTIGEITVQEWQKAKLKVQKAINDPTQDQVDVLSLLGIQTHEMNYGKYGMVEGAAKGFEEIFWQIGETLKEKVENGDMTQDLADTYANTLFGKSFAELKPLFALGAEGFAEALDAQTVASEEAIEKNAELNDKLIKLQNSFTALKAEVLQGMAPALTSAAESIDGLLARIMEYLETPEGQQALENMETAVSGLFEDLGKIDPEQVTQGFIDVFGKIVDSISWISDNWGGVVTGLESILAVFVGFKGLETVVMLIKLIDGIKTLGGGGAAAGAGAGAAATGAGAGAAAGGGLLAKFFGSTLTKVLGGAAAGTAVLFENAYTAQGNDDLDQWFANQEEYDRKVEETRQKNKEYVRHYRAAASERATGVSAEILEESGEPMKSILSDEQISAVQKFWDVFRENKADFTDQDWANYEGAFEGMDDLFKQVDEAFDYFHQTTDESLWPEDLPDDFFKTLVAPELPDDAEATLQGDLNGMNLEATVTLTPDLSLFGISLAGRSHANGLPYVPFDGYAAVLHKGERVVPAREEAAGSRSYSSNLYVESMYMNNGTDAEGLAAAIAAANRRTMNGFGS